MRLSQLFAKGKNTLVIYSYMFGPDMTEPCPLCTSILDGLDAQAQHITQRVNLVAIAKSPIPRVAKVAKARGWRFLRVLSSHGTSYNSDYHAETEDGDQLPALNVFTRKKGKVVHRYSTELLYGSREKGQDFRHVDVIWPLWNVFDFTPDGRGDGWYPSLRYDRG